MPKSPHQEASEMIQYLEGTLIPDLKESGLEFTAEDFERCVKIMKALMKKGGGSNA